MLLVVGHPGIGAALETLLRIEDRYEVRRTQSLDQVAPALDGWVADLALVDEVIAQNGRTEALEIPTIVLSGNPADGKRLSARLRIGRGWLRKDATADELRTAIDGAIAQGASRSRIPAAVIAAAVGLITLVVALAWYLVGMRG